MQSIYTHIELDPEKPWVTSDRGNMWFVRVPTNFDHVLPALPEANNHTVADVDYVKQFVTYTAKDRDVCSIGGHDHPHCSDDITCDSCGGSPDHESPSWWGDRDTNTDYCEACVAKDPTLKGDMVHFGAADVNVNALSMGSLLDWVPVLYDRYGHAVLYNINTDSPYYHRIGALTVDNHGRDGFHMLEKNITLNDYVKELDATACSPEVSPEVSWRAHYGAPIVASIDNRGNVATCGDVHYG